MREGEREPRELHPGGIAAATGTPLGDAEAAMIMIHGRGDSAAGILALARVFRAAGMAFVAPEARHNVWYPQSFMAPVGLNEPWLTSALAAVGQAFEQVTAAGVPREKVVLLGFSQGACLASEYAARNAGPYGGVVALSGGLIGDELDPARYPGSLAGTPAFFGCSDVDPHIPELRVRESSLVYRRLGATVVERIYPNFGHDINQDEIDWVQDLLDGLLGVSKA
ncbi:MAG TPA: PE-PPE domain-containing protein [Trueperaceae bacterium]|nr:PE-PPE domain-containing protein [Trueperaceae bacterium]